MANFGTLGDLNSYRGSQKPTGLPQWLADQFTANTTVDEGGGQNTTYSLNDNPYGGFLRDGKYYVQVGSNKLKDPAKATTDPELGDITEVSNVVDPVVPTGPEWWMPALVVGAGLVGAAAGLGEGISSAATVAGTDAAESGGTLALNAAGTGTSAYVPAGVEGATAAGATTGTTGVGPGAGDLGTDAFGGTTPLPETPPPAPGPTTVPDPSLPPGTQPPAPVTTANPQPGTGLINNVRNGPLGQTWDWYRGLSPTARFVVNQGLSTAGNAALGAMRQRSAQQAANEAEQRARADTIRRGQIPAFGPSAFTPIPGNPGIINGARGGK